jgi:RNA polymerase sigma factor (sigma-70 family)
MRSSASERAAALHTSGSRFADGRVSEFDALLAACEYRIGKYLVQMVGDVSLAEDLLQDTFHDAFRSRARLADVRSPVAWLYGIARNHALAALRRRRRLQRAIERAGRRRLTGDTTQEDAEIVGLRDLLERTLSANDRALIVLRYLHGFSAVELAEMTGRSPDAVRQRLARACAALVAASGETVAEREEIQ